MKKRNLAVGAGGLFCAAGMVMAMGGTAQADPPGNNGTIKVHELGTPVHTESNDPHVCAFNLEYYNQDAGQQGFEVKFFTQAPTQPKDVLALTIQLPQAGADGYSESVYLNADPGTETDGYVLPDGHYVAIVYGKNGSQTDEKAKSKVFWVKCDQTTPPSSSTTSTTSSSTTPPPSSTTSTTSSSTTPPPTTTTSTTPSTTTGPPIVTDGPGHDGGVNTGLLGGGLVAAGVTLAGAGYLRRRMSE